MPRPSMGRLLASLVCFAAISAFARSGGAAIPDADNPRAYTDHDYRRQLADYNRRSLPEAYRRGGRRNARWDAAAEKFLDAMAQRLADGGVGWWYAHDGPTLAELEKLGRAATKAGCDDPLVSDMLAITLVEQNRSGDARPLALAASESFAASAEGTYPWTRVMSNARRARGRVDAKREPELHAKLDRRVRAAVARVVRDAAALPPGHFDRRAAWSFLDDEVKSGQSAQAKRVLDAIDVEGADPWLLAMFTGQYHVVAAWDARGSEYGDTVTEEGWRSFREHLAKGRAALVKAQGLEPHFPDPAAELITVAMGGATEGDETERYWFEQAVKAQFDFRPAYTKLLWSLRPRWGGSHEKMYELGLECLATKRFDTRLPDLFAEALQDIRADLDGSPDFYGRPGVLEKMMQVARGYALLDTTPPRRRIAYFSRVAGCAWQARRYDLGRAALDAADGQFDVETLNYTGVLPERTVSGLYALSGPHANALLAAENGTIDPARAAEAYQQVAAFVQPEDRSSRWIRGRATEHGWLAKFNAGEWVDLMPGDGQLDGWYPYAGNWELRDGALVGTSVDASGAKIHCGGRFGTRFELRGAVRFDEAPPNVTDAGAGPIFGWADSEAFSGMYVHAASGRVTWRHATRSAGGDGGGAGGDGDDAGGQRKSNPASFDEPARFTLTLWDGHGFATVNDTFKVSITDVSDPAKRPDTWLGLTISYLRPGFTVRFSDVQVRKLKNDPAG